VTKRDKITYRRALNRSKKIWFSLTIAQYVELKRLYAAYRKAFKKESDRLMKGLIDAFIAKNDLFSGIESEEEPEEISEKDFRLFKSLLRSLDDVELPYKRING
jgi:hypothetical protein